MRPLSQTGTLATVLAAAWLGWAQPATAQVPVRYYSQPYYSTVYPANPYVGYATVPAYSFHYGYQYQWNYVYRPWGGYSVAPRYYTPPSYWGSSVRWTRGGVWRAW